MKKLNEYFVIPESFEMVGKTIHVILDPSMLEDRNNLGEALCNANEIRLSPCSELNGEAKKYGHDLAYDNHVSTFWHEFFHIAFNAMGYRTGETMEHNEKNVDMLAQFTQQFFKTKAGKLK